MTTPAPQTVTLNTRVEIEWLDPDGENERLAFQIVPDAQADFYAGYLGISTPLAHAILGKTAGVSVLYETGSRIQQIRILSVTAGEEAQSGEAAARRKAAVQEAIIQVERTNALIFATSVESKWGDYDADGMIQGWEEAKKQDE